MRIIRQGVAPSEVEYQLTCRYCGTVFAFYMNSVTQRHEQRDGSWYEVKRPHKPCGRINSTSKLYPLLPERQFGSVEDNSYLHR